MLNMKFNIHALTKRLLRAPHGTCPIYVRHFAVVDLVFTLVLVFIVLGKVLEL